jgi:hypothetical protein
VALGHDVGEGDVVRQQARGAPDDHDELIIGLTEETKRKTMVIHRPSRCLRRSGARYATQPWSARQLVVPALMAVLIFMAASKRDRWGQP